MLSSACFRSLGVARPPPVRLAWPSRAADSSRSLSSRTGRRLAGAHRSSKPTSAKRKQRRYRKNDWAQVPKGKEEEYAKEYYKSIQPEPEQMVSEGFERYNTYFVIMILCSGTLFAAVYQAYPGFRTYFDHHVLGYDEQEAIENSQKVAEVARIIEERRDEEKKKRQVAKWNVWNQIQEDVVQAGNEVKDNDK